MIDKFLKAKHWQIFIITFGIPLIFQFVMMGSIFSSFGSETSASPELMFNYFKFFPVIMIIFMAVFFGWFWSVAIGLQKKIPTNITMKLKRFKIFFFIPLVYITFISVFMVFSMGGLINNAAEPNMNVIGSLMAVILPLHLFSMFCMFHTLYFVAKTLKTVELQQEVRFSDFAGEFFMIWFFPVGLWILQPKINKIIEE